MARVIVELTNRCNLRCRHCFPERHAATGDLPVSILERLVGEGKTCGIDHLCFSGGEPTIHRQFKGIVARVCEAQYTFSFVSNGLNFPRLVPLLKEHRRWFRGVTFSLDGAREATHDRLRGDGSYRQVMRAATTCVFNDLPFTFNMVLTAHNRTEVDELVRLGGQLGSRGLRFGHLMFTPRTHSHGLDLSPIERREVEDQIWQLKKTAPVNVDMAPGYYSESPFFPCAPLELEEFNVDYRGNSRSVAICQATLEQMLAARWSAICATSPWPRRADASGSESVCTWQTSMPEWSRAHSVNWTISHAVYCVNYLGKVSPELPLSWPTSVPDPATGTGRTVIHLASVSQGVVQS